MNLFSRIFNISNSSNIGQKHLDKLREDLQLQIDANSERIDVLEGNTEPPTNELCIS